MGCCMSNGTAKNSPTLTTNKPNNDSPHKQHYAEKPPVPEYSKTHVGHTSNSAVFEEETVKEVLSETAIPKPVPNSPNGNNIKETQVAVFQHENIPNKGFLNKAEEVSLTSDQITEITCSMSESLSMATTISENKEDDEATSKRSGEVMGKGVKAKVARKRQYAGDHAGRREPIRGKVTPKRAEYSPEKKTQVMRRSINGRERTGKLNVADPGVRRVYGEGCDRRSRSPAKRAAGRMSKENSPMKVNRGGVDRSEAVKSADSGGGMVEEPKDGGNDGVGKVEEANDDGVGPTNESLENPLVSLECFIFL